MSPEVRAQRAVDILDNELSRLGSPISRHAAETIVIRLAALWAPACPHCGSTTGRENCAADPYINAEPRTYCSVAREHLAAHPPAADTMFERYDTDCIPGN